MNLEDSNQELKTKKNLFKSKKRIIIIFLILVFFFLILVVFFFLNSDERVASKPEENKKDETKKKVYLLDSLTVENYEYLPSFEKNIYDYYLLTEENKITISCSSDEDVNIKGCNSTIDLSDYSSYVHEIIIGTEDNFTIYRIYIKKKEKDSDSLVFIDTVKKDSESYTNKAINLEVNATSSNKIIKYSFDNGNNWQKANKIEISTNGVYNILAEDEKGNKSPVKTVFISEIDNISPTAMIIKKNSSKKTITLSAVATDELSGIASYEWKNNGYTSSEITVTEPGTYTVTVTDKANNITETSITLTKEDFIKEKRYVAVFDKNGADSIDYEILDCTQSKKNCFVTLPNIKRENGNIIGWSLDPNAKKATYQPGESISISEDTVFYAITKKDLEVDFAAEDTLKLSSTKEKCTIYNKDSFCYVITPEIKKSDGHIIGFNQNSKEKTMQGGINNYLKVYDGTNVTYHALAFRVFTAKFVQNKDLYSIDGCDATNTKECILKCVDYGLGYCSIKMPYIYSVGKEVYGFKDENSKNYAAGIFYKISQNKIFQPNLKNIWHKSDLSIKDSKKFGNTIFEVDENCSPDFYNKMLPFVEKLYKNSPYLFKALKVNFVSIDFMRQNFGSYAGMTYNDVEDSNSNIDIQCDVRSDSYYLGAVTHELAHSADRYYAFHCGKRISQQEDIINLYNKYKEMPDRPFRDYSYTNTKEFWADIYENYYFLYIDSNIAPDITSAIHYYPNEITLVVEKYIKILKET